MHVWLITVGEPLVCDQGGARIMRTGLLAEMLASHGHSVDFWSSTFDHVRKTQRGDKHMQIEVRPGYNIRLLHGPGYSTNVSLKRIWNHRVVAQAFRRQAETLPRPDVILCSLPTLELCEEAVEFGRRHQVPVVLDVRDLWPDLFLDLLPKRLRSLGPYLLWPMFRQVRAACSGATAITGSTEEYVDWAIGYSGRSRSPRDQHFPMAYTDTPPSPGKLAEADAFWDEMGIGGRDQEFVLCWFGMVGRHSELDTVIEATRRLMRAGQPVRTVLCGLGPDLDRLRDLARDCPNVVLPGWVNSAQIWSLLRRSQAGLAPYISNSNYIHNIPNKPIEYLSAGLPVVSSLQGALSRLLTQHDCGFTYANRDPDALCQVLSTLRGDSGKRATMAQNALRLYQDQFVAGKVYFAMQEYLCGIAGASTRPWSRAA